MKKLIITLATVLVVTLMLAGCGNSSADVETQTEESTKASSVPEWMTDIYSSFQNVVSDNNLKFTIGDLFSGEDADGNKTYSIRLTSPDAFEFDILWWEIEGNVSRSFNIDLDEKADVTLLKEFMACSVAVVDPNHDYANATEIVKTLANTFDGKNETSPIVVGSYKVYMKPPIDAVLSNSTMEFVYIDEQNSKVDVKQFNDFNGDEMNAPLNKGEKAHLQGTITSDVGFEKTNALEIENNNGKYVVYYDSQDFAGMFEVGDTFDFYGTIDEEWEGYKGTLDLEYCE